MIDLDDPTELERAEHAAEDLFALARRARWLGVGRARDRRDQARQPAPACGRAAIEAIKRPFDPKGLLNPGKKF